MPITIQRDSLLKTGYSLKYITSWDNLFKRNSHSGKLLFYKGNPLYTVDVQILADRDKLAEEDILITVGEYHNASNIDDMINTLSKNIFALCKITVEGEFLLDLDKMKILGRGDFTELFPIHGLNTLFIFNNINGRFFSLVNPTKNINSEEFYSWYISYIYSLYTCLTPRNKIDDYSKKFLQAISLLASKSGRIDGIKLSKTATVLNCELNDVDELLLEVPGNNTKRFEQLVEASLEQIVNHKHKKEKKSKK